MGWRFGDGVVTLPHTVTPLSWRRWDPASWQRVWTYERRFGLPHDLDGLRLSVDFGAALAGATPTLDGHDLEPHLGGYLPFGHEVTGLVTERDNDRVVVFDARLGPDDGGLLAAGRSPTPAASARPGSVPVRTSLRGHRDDDPPDAGLGPLTPVRTGAVGPHLVETSAPCARG